MQTLLNDSILRFPGFTPVVEVDASGRTLVRLPEQLLLLPGELTRRGTLALGLPGSGKSTRLIERGVIAALGNPEAAVVVFAVQPGSARQALAAFGHLRPDSPVRPALFNPGDAPACTHYINPIAGVCTRSEAMMIGQTLGQPVHAGSASQDTEYFLQQATTMIGHAIRAVNSLHDGQGTLAMIRQAIDGGAAALRALGERGKVPELVRFAGEIIEGNRNSETTMAQMSNCLQWLFNEQASLATSRQELNLDALLLKRPGLLVLSVNEEEVPRQRALMSLIFRNLFAWIISRARRHGGVLPRPLYIFIDELPAAGRIPEFGVRLTATFRKSNVSVFAAAQCEAQLAEVYGSETPAVLAGFGSRLYVPPIDYSDAERASERSGLIEVATHVTDSHGRVLSSNPMVRPLLLPGEIASPPRDPELGPRILFRLPEMPAFFGYLRATWQIPEENAINALAATLTLPRRRRRGPPPGEEPAGRRSHLRRISDPTGWSPARLNKRYWQVMDVIGYAEAKPGTLRFWDGVERLYRKDPAARLRLVEEIARRQATISEFQKAYHAAGGSYQAALNVLDRRHEEKNRGPSFARSKPKRQPSSRRGELPFEDDFDDGTPPEDGRWPGEDDGEEDDLVPF